jgi:hypothetical protein
VGSQGPVNSAVSGGAANAVPLEKPLGERMGFFLIIALLGAAWLIFTA